MRKADVSADMVLLFSAIFIIAVYAIIAILFINSVDESRVITARVDWHTEAILLSQKLVNSPNCFGYSKLIIRDEDNYFSDIDTQPLFVDKNKLFVDGAINIKRAMDCLMLNSTDYYLFLELSVIKNGETIGPVYSADPNQYRNVNTLQTIQVPIVIIGDNEVSKAILKVTFSISSEYMEVKLI